MRAVPVLLLLALIGCTPQFVFQMGSTVSPERVEWERQITETVNTHESRLERLEKGTPP